MRPDFYKKYFEIEQDHWVMKVRRYIVSDLFRKFNIDKKPAKIKILDFGCGSGYFVGELQKHGYQVWGVDSSQEAIDFGVSKGIRNLSIVGNESGNFPDNHFDVVLALDVLEHIEDEPPIVRELERVLRPGGTLIVFVPAFMFLWGPQDEANLHYRRYKLAGLTDVVLKNSNLKVVRRSYFNTFLFLPITIVRLASRWFNLRGRESDFEMNSEFLNKIFFGIFNLERKMLRNLDFPFGTSIMLILKKS